MPKQSSYPVLSSLPSLSDIVPITSGGGTQNVTVADLIHMRLFDVRDYGAIGDGVTNDASAVQLAVNAAGAASGIVYFPRGTYKLNSSITVAYSNIVLQGDGYQATTILAGGTSLSLINILATGQQLAHIKIRDLKFNTNSLSESRSIKIDSGGTSDSVDDVLFENCLFDNINTTSSAHILTTSGAAASKGPISRLTFRNCDFSTTTSYHLYITGDNVTDLTIDKCRFHNSQKGAIKFEGTNSRTYQDWEIKNSRFYNNSLSAVATNVFAIGDINRVGVVRLNIHHNFFGENSYSFRSQNFAIHIHPGWGMRIENNYFWKINTALAIGASNNGDQFQVDPDFMVHISKNVFYKCRGVADHDASIFAIWDKNIFYEIITQGGIGTFSRHYPSKYIDNYIYNSPSAIEVYDSSEFTFSGIYISPGVTYQGNTVIDDRLLPDPTIAPVLTQVAGGSLGARTYDVVYTWENGTGETNISPSSTLSVSANNLLVVTQPYSSTVGVPTGAYKVNVYVSPTSGGTKTKQDYIAVPWHSESQADVGGRTIYESGALSWTEPSTGLITGASVPTANTTHPLTIYGILELTSSSTVGLATIYRNNEFYGMPIPIQGNGTFKRISQNNLANGYFQGAKRATSGAMTNSSSTLTVGSSVFVAGDVGKNIIVFAAGANGTPLYTTISGFTSGTQVTLADNAQATVSSKAVIWGTNTTISNANATIVEHIPYTQGNATGSTTFDVGNGEVISFTRTGSITTTISSPHYIGQYLTLISTHDGTAGAYTMSKPSNVSLAGGVFSPTNTANAIDRWVLKGVSSTNWVEVSRALNIS